MMTTGVTVYSSILCLRVFGLTQSESSKNCNIQPIACCKAVFSVSIIILGLEGTSYTSSTPVNCFISPFFALLYIPLTSLVSQMVTEHLTYSSMNLQPSPIITLASSLFSLYGLTRDTHTETLCSVNNFAICATALLCSDLPTFEKSFFVGSHFRNSSPSKSAKSGINF